MKLDRRRWFAALGATVAALLAACGGGGGVDTGGTGAPLAFTSGTVTGFGSVIVNGIRFDDSGADVFDDRLPNALDSVTVGGNVEIHGRFDPVTNEYRATRIEPTGSLSEFRLRGPVSSLDTTMKRFRIGTQMISCVGLELPADLRNGAFVRLRLESAPRAGEWIATRIDSGDRAPEDRSEARIEGLVNAFASPSRFSVDGVEVDASGASFPDGPVSLGAKAEVEGSLSGGVLVAKKVGLETESETYELHGTISGLDTTAQTFVVRGVTVHYDSSTRFDELTVADLANGLAVEVRGVVDGGAVLQASRIKRE